MNDLLEPSDEALIDAAKLTEEALVRFENQLAVFAAGSVWTGDPMRQPLATVAALTREILEDRRHEGCSGGSIRRGPLCQIRPPLLAYNK